VAVLYLPYLSVGTGVFGFLGGYVSEEHLDAGSGILLWQLLGTVLPLPAQAFSYYLPAAAALLGVLGLACVFLRREPKADLAAAMVLAIAFTVLFSPHYSWYFAWIIPFLCCYPSVAAIYLTCCRELLHLGIGRRASAMDC